MSEKTATPAPRQGICWSYPIAIVALCSAMASCFLQSKPEDTKTAVQQWRESRGPVIPHDTFPKDCTLCHEKGSWHEIRKDFVFDHAKETSWPLNGAHQGAQCLRCHNDRGAVSVFAKRGCTGCHEDIHRGRLGTKCTTCHSENDWNPGGIYAVHAATRFPLVGTHVGVSCVRCHPSSESGQFVGADPRCEACHRRDAISARSFDHAAQGALTNCQQCHTQTAWADANPHVGNFSDCVRCHRSTFDAQNVKDPGHAGFGTGCVACHHSTSTWSGATFNHTYFPTSHGNANGTCSRCHPSSTNFKIFDCLTCHPKNSELDSHHRNNVNTYYNNSECYRCHPNGKAGKATFR